MIYVEFHPSEIDIRHRKYDKDSPDATVEEYAMIECKDIVQSIKVVLDLVTRKDTRVDGAIITVSQEGDANYILDITYKFDRSVGRWSAT